MDEYSYLLDRNHRFLLIGLALFVLAAICLLAGDAPERSHGLVYRAQEPRRFFWDVVLYFLGGFFFIGLYLIQNSN